MTLEFNTSFKQQSRPAASGPGQERTFRILLPGPYAGGSAAVTPQPVRLDMDSLPQVLADIAPTVEVLGHRLAFSTIESFEPLEMARAHPLTAALLQRLSALRSEGPNGPSVDAALKSPPPKAEPPAAAAEKPASGDPTFADLLGGSAFQESGKAQSRLDSVVDKLIQNSMGGVIASSREASFNALLQSVGSALAEQLRTLYHDPAFRRLESLWLPLAETVDTFADDDPVEFILFPFSEVLWTSFLDDPATARQWMMQQAEASPSRADLIASPHSFTLPLEERALEVHGLFGDVFQCPVLAHLDLRPGLPSTAGSLLHEADLPAGLAALASPAGSGGQRVRFALPGWRYRLPYGEKGEPVESFNFEELTETEMPAGLPQAPASLLYARGWAMRVCHEDLWEPWFAPLQLTGFPPIAGETRIFPAADFMLTEKAQVVLQQAHCLPILSGKNSDQLILSSMSL